MNTVAAVVMYVFVAAVMEFLIEKKIHIKRRCIKRIGSTRYVVLVFGVAIAMVILLSCSFPGFLENDWLRGALMGLWMFSLINITLVVKSRYWFRRNMVL